MKPAPFEYVAPRTLDEALDALARGGPDAKVLAGGQSLIPLLNFRLARPTLLVDLNRIPALAFVQPRNGGGGICGANRPGTCPPGSCLRARPPPRPRGHPCAG